MTTFNFFNRCLLKLAKIDFQKDIWDNIITPDPATEQFFGGVHYDYENKLLKIRFLLTIKSSRLENLDLDKKIIEVLEKKESYVTHEVDSIQNQVIFSFGFGQQTELVEKILSKINAQGELDVTFGEAVLEEKKQFIETQKQDLINIENILEEKREFLEKTKKELKEMLAQNEEDLELKKELQKQGLK